MKPLIHLLLLLGVVLFPLTGCKKKRSYLVVSPSTMRQTQAFSATVDSITVVDTHSDAGVMAYLLLNTADGRRLSMGGYKSSPEMRSFIESFRKGQTYSFPQALLDFEKTNHVQLQ